MSKQNKTLWKAQVHLKLDLDLSQKCSAWLSSKVANFCHIDPKKWARTLPQVQRCSLSILYDNVRCHVTSLPFFPIRSFCHVVVVKRDFSVHLHPKLNIQDSVLEAENQIVTDGKN